MFSDLTTLKKLIRTVLVKVLTKYIPDPASSVVGPDVASMWSVGDMFHTTAVVGRLSAVTVLVKFATL